MITTPPEIAVPMREELLPGSPGSQGSPRAGCAPVRSARRSRTTGSMRLAVVTAISGAVIATTLPGCSGVSSSSAGPATQSPAAALDAGPRSDSSPTRAFADKAGATAGAATGTEVTDQKLARSGTLSLQVKDIGEATARVRAINLGAGGVVLSENIGSYPAGETASAAVNPKTYAVLVISVPVDELDSTLDELQHLGTVLDRHSETQNVTADYVDVQARVTSMKKSVARVQDLIDKTSDIDQLVRLEQELAARQADLESMEAQLANLDRQTARSPITVNLTTDPALVTSSTTPAEGFTGGLAKGWKAFVASVVALMTVLGAVLPFALLIAVLAAPAMWLWRRSRSRRTPAREYAAPKTEKTSAGT